VGEYKGILLADLRLRKIPETFSGFLADPSLYPTGYGPHDEPEVFHVWTIHALKLVEYFDPPRFRRVQKYLRYIVNTNLISSATYNGFLHACSVDLHHFPFEDDSDWYRIMYASTFVHEATHGVIEARGIPYTRCSAIRIERLCHEEERRFLGNVDPWWAENLGELDEEWVKSSFGRWWRFRQGMEREERFSGSATET
jgi:hypothetical protein